MESWLSRAERQTLLALAALLLAGYALVGWREWRASREPVALDSLDLAFIREGQRLQNAAAGLDPDSLVESLWFPLDLNRADSLQLLRLPGVGPGRAAAILALRRTRGPFRDIHELLEVKGIGPATLERMRDKLTVNPDLDDMTTESRATPGANSAGNGDKP